MTDTFPTAARIVVIGGGVIGTSIAYHLAKAGEQDVILLEKTKLTEGATWHAAGLVGQFRSQQNLMSMMNDSVSLFDRLTEETGQETGWQKVGSLRIAASDDRWKELLRSHSAARAAGFEMEMLTPDDIGKIHPLIKTSDLVGGAFIPDDGHIDPYSLTQAYAKGIKDNGGRIFEGVMVRDLVREGRRVTRVVTDHGNIDADIIVNTAGLWARQVGWMAGAEIPAGVVEHQFLVTEKSDQIPEGLPVLRDPDGGYYAKPEPGALAFGGWEKVTVPVNPVEGFPWECSNHLFETNMERLLEMFEPATERFDILSELGIRDVINGPIPISPDGEPVMGPVPGLDNVFAACAFTSGIAASGGAGKAMANWILHGDPGLDLWAFDIRRFGLVHAGPKFLHDRALESYSKYYALHYPGEELESARGVRKSPLYDTLKQQGAVFGSKFGWERANWFAYDGIPQVDVLGYDRPQQDITVGREHRAARESVVLIDQTSFTKFEISGRDACRFLQYLAVANVDKEPGGAAYTQLCNAKGGIEADVTIIRRSDDVFWLITGSGNGVRDRQWMESHIGDFSDVSIRDITSAYGVINLAGPLSRKVLEKVCDDDISHEGFPFMTARDIRIGYAPVLAFRVSYIGEQGWELSVPMEYMLYVYETLKEAGQEFNITNLGYRAIDSLRLEKRYLAWGADITPDYNPYEAGLQFLIDWSKGNFIGAEALSRIREEGVRQKLVCLSLDDPLPVFGGEAILSGDAVIGQTTSGNFSYTVGKCLVLGYLPVETLDNNSFDVESFGEYSKANLIKGAAYDPERKRILC